MSARFVLEVLALQFNCLDIVGVYYYHMTLQFSRFSHEAELAQAAAQPLPDDDDDVFDWTVSVQVDILQDVEKSRVFLFSSMMSCIIRQLQFFNLPSELKLLIPFPWKIVGLFPNNGVLLIIKNINLSLYYWISAGI